MLRVAKCRMSELGSNNAAVLIKNMHAKRTGKFVDDLGLGLVKRLCKIIQINAPRTARSKIARRQRFTRSDIPDKECCKHGRSSMRSPTTGLYRIRLLGALHTKKGLWITKDLLMLSERLGAVHRSAAPCPPTGWTRSTLGARGLSFRVRNGTGRTPPAMAADRWAAPAGPGNVRPRVPSGPHSASRDLPEPVGSARAAATADHPGGPVERVKSSGD